MTSASQSNTRPGPRTRRLWRWGAVGCALIVLLVGVVWAGWIYPLWGAPFRRTSGLRPPITPAWALECWLWEDDANTAERVRELLEGYRAHDIPVRTILLDSPWSMRYNDFVVDPVRYPGGERFVAELKEQGYRVALWMTCMVNSENDDTAIADASDWFADAATAGYLAGGAYQWKWWKGRGGFIDYTNPDAMAWWRGMQQPLFDAGLDAWKLDGTATFFSSRIGPIPLGWQRVRDGWMTTRDYMDRYYRDEYRHGVAQNPEFVTLSRSLDRYLHPEGFAPLDAAPVTWVGDQDHAWSLADEGIEEAIADILRSARLGYAVIGSDVAGFSGAVIPPRLYIRWAQFSAFCPLFMNGGHGERALWKRSPLELDAIRRFAWLHTELVPYVYSAVVKCAEGGPPVIRPFGDDYQYLYGDALLVAPIYRDTPTREVTFPKGRWRYLFDERRVVAGPARITEEYPLDAYPVYVREGSVIPMEVSRPYTGFGDEDSKGSLTLAIYPEPPSDAAVAREHAFVLPGAPEPLRVTVEPGEALVIRVAPVDDRPLVLRVACDEAPESVERDGERLPFVDVAALRSWSADLEGPRPVPRPSWGYDSKRGVVWIWSDRPDGRFTVHPRAGRSAR